MTRSEKKTILLVEDEALIAASEKMALEKYGYLVLTASTGENAIATTRENPEIDLILMDINLGTGIDGTRAAELILQDFDLPILFVSSHSEREVVEKTENISSYGYVVKSSSITVLDASIKMAFKLFNARQGELEKERILQDNKDRYENILNTLDEGVALNEIVCDSNGEMVNYRILEVNEAFYRLTGVPKEKNTVIGSLATEIYGMDEATIRYFWVNHKDAVGVAHTEFESPITKQIFLVSTSPFSDGKFVTTFRDISGQKKAEESRRHNEALFRSVFDQSAVGSVIVGMDKKFIRLNAAFCNFLGYDEGELIGKTIADITYPEDVKLGMAEMRQLMDNRIESTRFEKRYLRKNGSVVWGEINISLIKDDADEPLFFLPTIIDITERKLAEKKIADLLAEKELTLKEVHHRIKNNMGTIGSLLSLQAHSTKNSEISAALEEAGNRIRTMQLLYDKLYRSDNFSRVSVKDYLFPLVEAIINNYPKIMKVRVTYAIEDFELEAAILQPLGIMINELLTNIMKYAFVGKDDGQIIVAASLSANLVSVVVQDDGVGMPESIGFGNTPGFGLELIHALTMQLDGKIRIERGAGTKVVLEFNV